MLNGIHHNVVFGQFFKHGNYSVDSISAFLKISGLTMDFPLPTGVTVTINEIPPCICSEIPSLSENSP